MHRLNFAALYEYSEATKTPDRFLKALDCLSEDCRQLSKEQHELVAALRRVVDAHTAACKELDAAWQQWLTNNPEPECINGDTSYKYKQKVRDDMRNDIAREFASRAAAVPQ